MIDMLYKPFQKWSANGSVFLFSDPHFDDDDCKIMDANWISAEEQVKIINKKVHKNDTIVILGDIGNLEYIKQIKGYKVLIKGNHDDGPKADYENVFDEVYEGPLFIAEKILLSHERIPSPGFFINIHGHDHAGTENDEFHLNLAANVIGYTPISLKELIKSGLVSKVPSIHRETINKATSRKKRRNKTR